MPLDNKDGIETEKISIVPFEEKYQQQAEDLILKVLEDLGFDPNPTYNAELKDIKAAYIDVGGMFVVAIDEEDKVVGTIGARPTGEKEGEIKRVFLDKEHRGKGLGKRLMDAAVSFLKDKGFERCILSTDSPRMEKAINFYKRLGFREYHRRAKDHGRFEVYLEINPEEYPSEQS